MLMRTQKPRPHGSFTVNQSAGGGGGEVIMPAHGNKANSPIS